MEKKAFARFALRIMQFIATTAAASYLFYGPPQPVFCRYHAFSYLKNVIFCDQLWSVTMLYYETYVYIKSAPPAALLTMPNLVASYLLLSAASSAACVSSYLVSHGESKCPTQVHTSHLIVTAFTFLSSFLSFAGTLVDLCLLKPTSW